MKRGNLRSIDGNGGFSNTEETLENGGGGGNDGTMDSRVKALENLIPTLATKNDLTEVRSDFQKGVNDLIKWIVGTAFVGMAMFVTIMAFVLNNAVPKAPTAPAPTPVTIQASQPAPAPVPIIIQMPVPPPPTPPQTP